MHPEDSGRYGLVALGFDVTRFGKLFHDLSETPVRAVHEIPKIPPVADRSLELFPPVDVSWRFRIPGKPGRGRKVLDHAYEKELGIPSDARFPLLGLCT